MKFLADENFNNRILRGVRLKAAEVIITRVQDTEIYQAEDPQVLAWAAEHDFIVLTYDVNTMIQHAYERVRNGQSMPGVLAIRQNAAIGEIMDDLLMIIYASTEEEWENQVTFLPL